VERRTLGLAGLVLGVLATVCALVPAILEASGDTVANFRLIAVANALDDALFMGAVTAFLACLTLGSSKP
jgi:hypothetical protein